jgi:predicted TIM-barrel fold metal-dependent hydrolase
MNLLPFPIIDFHVHLFPDRLFDAIWRSFREKYNWQVRYSLYTPQVIEFLRERSVEKIVFSNYAHKAGVARALNEWNLELLEREPDLYCFAAVHPDDPVEEALQMLEHPRVTGYKLQLLVQRFYPDDERLFPLYEKVIEAGKRILMHVGTGPIGNEFVGVKHFRRLMRRYPQLKVNVPHMGEFEVDEFFAVLDEFPGVFLDTAFVFYPNELNTYTFTPEKLLRHQDRIVYGSDFPNLIFEWETEIQALLDIGLDDAFYRRIFRENALKIL